MKFILIALGVLVLGVVLVQVYSASVSRGIEEYKYEVVKSYEDFEVRKYFPANFTTVTMNKSTYKESSGKGFRILAGYIFGGNEKEEKIAMTSPVLMEMKDSVTMSFLIPEGYQTKDMPVPNDKDIRISHQPEKIMAAIQFGGWADDDKIKQKSDELRLALEEQGITIVGDFMFAGYNPPFELLNRRNEVLVEVIYRP